MDGEKKEPRHRVMTGLADILPALQFRGHHSSGDTIHNYFRPDGFPAGSHGAAHPQQPPLLIEPRCKSSKTACRSQ